MIGVEASSISLKCNTISSLRQQKQKNYAIQIAYFIHASSCSLENDREMKNERRQTEERVVSDVY